MEHHHVRNVFHFVASVEHTIGQVQLLPGKEEIVVKTARCLKGGSSHGESCADKLGNEKLSVCVLRNWLPIAPRRQVILSAGEIQYAKPDCAKCSIGFEMG